MPFQSSFMVVLVTFFLLLFFFLFLWVAKNHNSKIGHAKSVVPKLPPGPWKLPLIGNLHQLVGAGSLAHHALRELSQRYGPLMHLQLGQISTVIVSSPSMAELITKTHDLCFVNRPQPFVAKIIVYGSADIIFSQYGDYWRQMRKICTLELLSAKRVQSFSYIREQEMAHLIQSIQLSAGSSIDLTNRIFPLTSHFVARAVFGDKHKHQNELLCLVKEVVDLSGGFNVVDLFPSWKPLHLMTRLKAKLEKIHKRIDEILEETIKENLEKQQMKAQDGNETLLEVLLRIQQSPIHEIPLTINNIKAVIWDLFSAGTDTSATTIDWAMSELMRNPRVREKAQAEIREAMMGKKTVNENDIKEFSYLKQVIKETLRLHPPAPLLIPRECRESCKIGGYDIPKKTNVMVNVWALGRDPQYWYDAESFIPERFHGNCYDFKGKNLEYIPFGAGRRMCPGVSFGLAGIELTLACLLYHFDWQLPNGMKPEDFDMTEIFGGVSRRKDNLNLIPSSYILPSNDNA